MDAVKIIRDARWRLEVGDITLEQYEELIAPLRDVETVVRCRDCKRWDKYHNEQFGECKWTFRVTKAEGYCNYGEWKDGDHHEG